MGPGGAPCRRHSPSGGGVTAAVGKGHRTDSRPDEAPPPLIPLHSSVQRCRGPGPVMLITGFVR